MNDVKDICDDLLSASPPPPDSAAVLAAARRSAGRHRATVAAGVGTLVLVVAAGGSALALRPAPVDTPAQQPPPAVAAPTAAPTSAPVAVAKETPAARAAYTHGATMRGLLLAAIPAGYTTEDYPTSYGKDFDPTAVLPNAQFPAPANGLLNVAFGGLLLQSGGGEGMLTAAIWASSAPAAEECLPGSCEVVTADGVSVEVRTWSDEGGRHISATRRLTGGLLTVTASQGLATGGTEAPLDGVQNRHPRVKPALPTLPFTTQQIAALALNPAMLQFP
ncbi:hypothetical protein AB0K00_14635 [Dactylosporangium sp. NPDC049525]|uniref:hypothetical protein n=1 Tax=Dactylosporangium sp. NPDC049525 TaxID=3154730 RepID=UPI003428BB45